MNLETNDMPQDDELKAHHGDRELGMMLERGAFRARRGTRQALVDQVDYAICDAMPANLSLEQGRRELVRAWVLGAAPSRPRRWLAAVLTHLIAWCSPLPSSKGLQNEH